MKKLYYLLFLLPVLALSQNQNYIKTTAYKVPTLDGITATDGSGAVTSAKKTVNVVYFDGLGRELQYLAHLQSGTGKNIITPIVYDASGVASKQYLPFFSESSTIAYTDNASVITSLQADYASKYSSEGQNPYSETKIEASPLRRTLKQASPGTDWMMPVNAGDPDHTIRFEYATNTATEVRRITASSSMPSAGMYSISTPTNAGYYLQGELFKSVIKDENWTSGNENTNDNTMVEFTNKEGQVVLKRTYESGIEHDTYYVYDQYGNLTYVMPPMADTADINDQMLAGYCYQYKYDNRNRLVEKKLPGKDWEFIVYDKLDRIVATGPVNPPFLTISYGQGWMIVKYDVFNRPVITGFMAVSAVTSETRKALQQENDAHPVANISETKSAANTTVNSIAFRYNNSAWPASTTSYQVLTVNYYDDYNFPDAPTDFTGAHYNNTDKKPKGLPTGSFVRVLTAFPATEGEKSFVLYDEYARAIKAYTKNYLGGYTQAAIKLDFAGKPIQVETTHKRDTNTPAALYIKDASSFTSQDRLLTLTHQIGTTGTPQLMRRNEYNALGQVVSKYVGGTSLLGSNALQKIDYAYTIRGWLRTINNVDNLGTDLFAYGINYNTVTNETSAIASKKVKKLYNGNISETIWKSAGDNTKRKYGYKYDSMNRLKEAIYQKPDLEPEGLYASVTSGYDEYVRYDKNGNIKKMQRNGYQDANSPVDSLAIDNLTYTYQPFSNMLIRVDDQADGTKGFKDGASEDYEYSTDGYGNLVYDANKDILDITYNHLNLPKRVMLGTGETIQYIYNALGTRVSKKVVSNGEVTESYYLDGFQYKGTVLEFFPTAEGYVDATAGVNKYVFNYKDHLGNIRLSYTKDGTSPVRILEENHYYPFGMEHSGYGSSPWDYIVNGGNSVLSSVDRNKSQYKFNGQEYQDDLGLNMTAMDYRPYDNALGRFHSIDVLSELAQSITPYGFGFNNPVYWTDPTGLFGSEGEAMAHIDKFGLSNATVSYNSARGYWEISNGGYNFWQTSSGSLWVGYSNSAGVYFVELNGGSSGGGSSGSSSSGPGGPGGPGPGGPGPGGPGPGGPGVSGDPVGLNFSMSLMAFWYEFGNKGTLRLNASSIDFTGTTQTELGITNSREPQLVNLFDSGVNTNSLTFGRIWMTRVNDTQFTIQNNEFNFEYRSESSFARNTGTFFGGLIFGRIYESHLPYLPYVSRWNHGHGGGYDVQFLGTVTIPR